MEILWGKDHVHFAHCCLSETANTSFHTATAQEMLVGEWMNIAMTVMPVKCCLGSKGELNWGSWSSSAMASAGFTSSPTSSLLWCCSGELSSHQCTFLGELVKVSALRGQRVGPWAKPGQLGPLAENLDWTEPCIDGLWESRLMLEAAPDNNSHQLLVRATQAPAAASCSFPESSPVSFGVYETLLSSPSFQSILTSP